VRRLVSLLLPILILAAGIGIFQLLRATRPVQEPPQVQERVWRVEAQTARLDHLAPELELYGRVETPALLRATAAAAAWVAEVRVRDGDRVRQGDVLLSLDERDFLHRIAQAEAEVADLRSQLASERNRVETDRLALVQEQRLLEIAEAAVARQERLKTQRVGAEQTLDEADQARTQRALAVSNREMSIADHPARLAALQARLERADARLDELRLEFERATIRAPHDGIITGVEVTTGDQVARGAVLVRLYAADSLEVRARIPAPFQDELLAALARGEALLATAQIGGETVALELDRLAGAADPSGVDGLFQVHGDPARLRLGQMLTLRLQRPPREAVLAVPFSAVYGSNRIYLIEDGRLRGIDVEGLGGRIGANGEERLLVQSPALTDGARIAITHMPNAMDGLPVEVVGSPATADHTADADLAHTAASGPDVDQADQQADAPPPSVPTAARAAEAAR